MPYERVVFGKFVSQDKNKITVERLDESRIIISTYSKREIDTRTLHSRNVPEARYYLELAQYFSGRTWDFTDDPDDFIQAIRRYEKAKHSITETQGRDSDRIQGINKKMEQLQADRRVWIREIESRAKLKKLEFEATIETSIKQLEDKVAATIHAKVINAPLHYCDFSPAPIKPRLTSNSCGVKLRF